MVLTKDTEKGIFALDKWLRNLGLWRGTTLRKLDEDSRRAAIGAIDFTKPYVLTGSAYDPEGFQVVTVRSETSYDPSAGLLDHKISFWRHLPWDGRGQRQEGERYVIAIRGRRDPTQDQSEIPDILPDQIVINGSTVFQGPYNGGKDDPYHPKHRRLADRVFEFGKRVNEVLNGQDPVQDLGKILSGGAAIENILGKIAGGTPLLRGLSDEGGFEKVLTPWFLDVYQEQGEKEVFRVRDLEHLKTVLGYNFNTVEPVRSMADDWDESATDMKSGLRYLTGTSYEREPATGRHVFRLSIAPEDPPDDIDAPEPFDIVRLIFTQKDDCTFVLDEAAFMEGGPEAFRTFKDYRSIVGFMQTANRYLAKRKYPPYRDIAARCHLLEKINELGVPSAEMSGGDMLWIPFFGTSLKKKVEHFGDGIGGGNMFMHRIRKDNGAISQVAAVVGFPWEPGGPDSDYDGAQPDFMPYWNDIKLLILDHDHFDHATLEFYASKGWMRGKKILCNERVRYIVEQRLKKLGATKDQWPDFLTYGPDRCHKDIMRTGANEYAYAVRDDDGKARLWVQCCENGTKHSALTDSHIITGCYGDDHYKTGYYLDNDAFGLNDHGWDFAARGQMALADLPGVTKEKLDAAYPDPDKLYVALHEPTSATNAGYAPKPEDVKTTWRECLKLVPDMAVIHIPFSTNHLEYQAMQEVWAEDGILRNSTAVGGNAEIRTRCMNRFGVNPYIDLRRTEIPPEILPQALYDVAIAAIEKHIGDRIIRSQTIAGKKEDGTTPNQVLAQDYQYQVLAFIRDQARAENNPKPRIIYDHFFSGRKGGFDEIAQILGLMPSHTQRKMPNVVEKALKDEKKRIEEIVGGGREARDAHVTHWIIRNILKNGKIKFETRGGLNEYAMYRAIMAGQEAAARHGVRTSVRARNYRADYGRLGIVSTGPTGSPEEQFASLSRFARGDSLFDYDEVVRNTGYKLDADKMIIFVTQAAPPGTHTMLAQDALMKDVVKSRDVTVFCAFMNGFKIYNPKALRQEFEARFRTLGWNVKWDAANNQLRIEGRPFHIHGHRFAEDLYEKVKSPRLKAALHEFIHIPSFKSFMEARQIVARAGKTTSIEYPDDHRAYRLGIDRDTGAAKMDITAYLTPSYWLVRLRRKYGLQYGGIVEMVRAVVMDSYGMKRTDGLDVRTDAGGYFQQNTAMALYNDWLKAGGGRSARQRNISPSEANIQDAGGRPAGRMLGGGIMDLKKG